MIGEEQKMKRNTLKAYQDEKALIHSQMLEMEKVIKEAEKMIELETISYTQILYALSNNHLQQQQRFTSMA